MTKPKPYEQMLPKPFYFGPPNFVEVLKVKSSLYEFSGIYKNVLVSLLNRQSLLMDLFVNREILGGGGFCKTVIPSSTVATGPAPMPPCRPCRRGHAGKRDAVAPPGGQGRPPRRVPPSTSPTRSPAPSLSLLLVPLLSRDRRCPLPLAAASPTFRAVSS